MFSALSRLIPRAFNRKSSKQQLTNVDDVTEATGGEPTSATKPFTCRVILLDDTELNLNVKVSIATCHCSHTIVLCVYTVVHLVAGAC